MPCIVGSDLFGCMACVCRAQRPKLTTVFDMKVTRSDKKVKPAKQLPAIAVLGACGEKKERERKSRLMLCLFHLTCVRTRRRVVVLFALGEILVSQCAYRIFGKYREKTERKIKAYLNH